MDKSPVSKATLGRLPSYLNYLRELPVDEYSHISATAIAKYLKLGEVQVRKDLAAVSGAGKPKVGYVTKELIARLEDYLGYNKITFAVLVGAGKLGRALVQFDEFERYGVKIVGAFNSNGNSDDTSCGLNIMPMTQFESFCTAQNIKLGIITVGEDSAQEVCDRMVKVGIKAIWNFAPCKLDVPNGVLLKNENLALSLAHLNNQLTNMK